MSTIHVDVGSTLAELTVPKLECVESRENYARFIAEPLAKGAGLTIGNCLRRTLLGHLQGAAVTRIRIEGIQHEFSTIPNIKEDVTDFILNVKALRIRPLSGRPGKLRLEATGEREIHASDIQPSADFEVANPELYLATLDSSDARLEVEFDVEISSGYKEAGSSSNLPIGVIPVDAIFTPVRKVNFNIEPLHIGQETSLERLVLEIWTDGTISPGDALSRSAGMLAQQLTPFASYRVGAPAEEDKESRRPAIPEELANMPVEQLNLSVRTLNCLRRGGITTVGELVSKEEKELLALRNFGQKSRQEIEERLADMGLALASSTPKAEKKGEQESEGGEGEKEESEAEQPDEPSAEPSEEVEGSPDGNKNEVKDEP